MRVLVVTNLYPNPYQLTRATFNRQQLRALNQQHPVRVISPIAWTEELLARMHQGNKLPRSRRARLDDITVIHPRYFFTPKLLRSQYGRFYKHSIARAFHEAVKEFQPDVVLAPWAYPDGWAAIEVARRYQLPVIIKVHGCDVLVDGKGLGYFRGRVQPTIDALRRADGIFAVSQDLANACIDLGVHPERIRVIYDGVDPRVFHPGPQFEARRGLAIDTHDPIILFAGRLDPVKGIDTLIKACAEMSHAGDRFLCLIIGEGPLYLQLQNLINTLNVPHCVQLLGPKAHDQLPHYFRASTVFVLDSYSEGVPCALLESAACGLPFVASRVGGIPEIAHLIECRIITPGRVDQLVTALHDLIAFRANTPMPPTQMTRTHADAVLEISALCQEVLERSGRKAIHSSSDEDALQRTADATA